MTRFIIAILLVVGLTVVFVVIQDTGEITPPEEVTEKEAEAPKEEIKALTQTGDTFQRSLSLQYIAMAEVEQTNNDLTANQHFNEKAQLAAEGTSPSPDPVSSRTLPEESLSTTTLAEITLAYDELVSYLKSPAPTLKPELAATAQAKFDCWLEGIEDNIPEQQSSVHACRDAFQTAMTGLRANIPPVIITLLPNEDGSTGKIVVTNETGALLLETAGATTKVISTQSMPSKPSPLVTDEIDALFDKTIKAQPAPPRKFTLLFRAGSTKMDAASKVLLPEIRTEATNRPTYDLSIVGHADRMGSEAFNTKLSQARAKTVKDFLVGQGVDGAMIELTFHGEGNLLIPTEDGVAEPKNRRVEITVR